MASLGGVVDEPRFLEITVRCHVLACWEEKGLSGPLHDHRYTRASAALHLVSLHTHSKSDAAFLWTAPD